MQLKAPWLCLKALPQPKALGRYPKLPLCLKALLQHRALYLYSQFLVKRPAVWICHKVLLIVFQHKKQMWFDQAL